ncbi:MAG: D-alanine--D-alanine ligase, partial [Actinomycetota bacterium]|nr:D-alanine--D-alanine ligase [Actinomycetota bacterium]
KALLEAAKYDEWIIIEEAITGREIEVAILEDGEPKASVPGEITPGADFYDYEDKYEDGATLQIPAPLTDDEILKVQDLARKVFKLLNCRDLARVDFFYEKSENEWLVNEINTMPGFTPISMYPKLWSATGVPYDELVNYLLSNSHQKRFKE